ncbi:DUF5708 family protein [Streptomyces sp. NPDC059853]|uniref:DUF5708 family protein n=1 Tax=Streptomyces sp. NPDC059853 TaxID=3346973 RepID=UPI0036523ED1
MTRAARHTAEGTAALLIGLGRWAFAGAVEVPVVELPKAGVVLAVVGGAQALYGAYTAVRARR